MTSSNLTSGVLTVDLAKWTRLDNLSKEILVT